jgi:hypothetical protein
MRTQDRLIVPRSDVRRFWQWTLYRDDLKLQLIQSNLPDGIVGMKFFPDGSGAFLRWTRNGLVHYCPSINLDQQVVYSV